MYFEVEKLLTAVFQKQTSAELEKVELEWCKFFRLCLFFTLKAILLVFKFEFYHIKLK